MGVPKEIFENAASHTIDKYNELQLQMFLTIGEELGKERALFLSDINSWANKRLNEIEPLRIKSERIVKQMLPGINEAIERSVKEASYKTLGLNEEEIAKLIKAGAKLNAVVPLEESEQIIAIVNNYMRRAKEVMNLTNTTMLGNVEQVYTDIVNVSTQKVLLGTQTADKAMRSTVNQFIERGLPALVDKAGRTRTLESYARTVIRTTSNQCANEMQDARYEEYGINLIEISSHVGARPKCAEFQGRVFALGNHPRHPNIYDEPTYGDIDSLFGINCSHVSYPFVEGISIKRYEGYDKKTNDKAYKNSQTQRKLERDIRSSKTKVEMFGKIGYNEGVEQAKSELRERQAEIRSFIKETGRTRRYDREWVG